MTEYETYLIEAITSYFTNPPDTQFQRGYLAALIAVLTEADENVAIPANLIERATAILTDPPDTQFQRLNRTMKGSRYVKANLR